MIVTTTTIDERPLVPDPPRIIGHALIAYRDRRGWRDEELAAFLGCDAWGLARLVFLACPDPRAPDVAVQVDSVAALVCCRAEALHAVVVDHMSGQTM